MVNLSRDFFNFLKQNFITIILGPVIFIAVSIYLFYFFYKLRKIVKEIYDKIMESKKSFAIIYVSVTLFVYYFLIYNNLKIEKEILRLLFGNFVQLIFALSIFYGALVIFVWKDNYKTVNITWEHLISLLIYTFAVSILNIVFIVFSDLIFEFNLSILILSLDGIFIIHLFWIIMRAGSEILPPPTPKI